MKNIILILITIIFLLGFVSNGYAQEPHYVCEDSDGDLNDEEQYYVTGTCSDTYPGSAIRADSCNPINGHHTEITCKNVEEIEAVNGTGYKCMGGPAAPNEYYCPLGCNDLNTACRCETNDECPDDYSCVAGNCVYEPVVSPTCTDSDGGNNLLVKGICSDNYGETEEECLSITTVNEYSCQGDICIWQESLCPQGSECNDGACQYPIEFTPGTDEGNTVFSTFIGLLVVAFIGGFWYYNRNKRKPKRKRRR